MSPLSIKNLVFMKHDLQNKVCDREKVCKLRDKVTSLIKISEEKGFSSSIAEIKKIGGEKFPVEMLCCNYCVVILQHIFSIFFFFGKLVRDKFSKFEKSLVVVC